MKKFYYFTVLFLLAFQVPANQLVELIISGNYTEAIAQASRNPREANVSLHLAVKAQQPELIKAIIQAGAYVDSIDSMGMTPLFLAVELKNILVIETLLGFGANPNEKNFQNISPLDLAQSSSNEIYLILKDWRRIIPKSLGAHLESDEVPVPKGTNSNQRLDPWGQKISTEFPTFLQPLLKKYSILELFSSKKIKLYWGRAGEFWSKKESREITTKDLKAFEDFCRLLVAEIPKYPQSFWNKGDFEIFLTGEILGSVAGVCSWTTLVLDVYADANTLHHELGHAFMNVEYQLAKQWTDRFWTAPDSPSNGFVTFYAKTSFKEDFAETFAIVMSSGINPHTTQYLLMKNGMIYTGSSVINRKLGFFIETTLPKYFNFGLQEWTGMVTLGTDRVQELKKQGRSLDKDPLYLLGLASILSSEKIFLEGLNQWSTPISSSNLDTAMTFAITGNMDTMVELLLQKGAKVKDQSKVLNLAVEKAGLKILKLLLEADVASKLTAQELMDFQRRTVYFNVTKEKTLVADLILAAHYFVKYSYFPPKLNSRRYFNSTTPYSRDFFDTPLAKAVFEGTDSQLEQLLKSGVSPKGQIDLLKFAVSSQPLSKIKMLFEYGVMETTDYELVKTVQRASSNNSTVDKKKIMDFLTQILRVAAKLPNQSLPYTPIVVKPQMTQVNSNDVVVANPKVIQPLIGAVPIFGSTDRFLFVYKDQVRVFDMKSNRPVAGTLKPISQQSLPGISFPVLDAVVSLNNGKAYFFSKNQYIRFDLRQGKADAGYPLAINEKTWPGVGFSKIDAAFSTDQGKIYFFSGNQYLRFDVKLDRADAGYPKSINDITWPGMGFEQVDGAFFRNNKVYFFKDDEMVIFDLIKDSAEPGYPRKIQDELPES